MNDDNNDDETKMRKMTLLVVRALTKNLEFVVHVPSKWLKVRET